MTLCPVGTFILILQLSLPDQELDYLIPARAFENWRARFCHEITLLTTKSIQSVIKHNTSPI